MAQRGSNIKMGLRWGLALMGILCLGACSAGSGWAPTHKATGALPGFPSHGVVNRMYVRVYEVPALDGDVVAVYPGGTVLDLEGRSQAKARVEGALDYWYEVSGNQGRGWVFGREVVLAVDEDMARFEAERLAREIFGP